MKIKEYKLLRDSDLDRLAARVNDLLKEGWEIIEGARIAVSPGEPEEGNYWIYYLQTLVRVEREEVGRARGGMVPRRIGRRRLNEPTDATSNL